VNVAQNSAVIENGSIGVGFNNQFDISGGSFDTSFDISTETTNPRQLRWSNSGDRLIVSDSDNSRLLSYSATTDFDISTLSLESTFDLTGQTNNNQGIEWSTQGDKLFVGTDEASATVFEYDASAAFDITSLTFNQSQDFGTNLADAIDIDFKPDGSKLFVFDFTNSDLAEYDLQTDFDITTKSFVSKTDVSSNVSTCFAFALVDSGQRCHFADLGDVNIEEFELTTPYDVSTLSFVDSFDVSTEDSDPFGVTWDDKGTSAYITGRGNNNVYEYDVGSPANSGDALVSFETGSPSDIASYDIATFQRTTDGETVTVDVEDSTGTVLKPDISKDTDISDIATTTDVQLRVNLSRNNTANNPTVDYIARGFTR